MAYSRVVLDPGRLSELRCRPDIAEAYSQRLVAQGFDDVKVRTHRWRSFFSRPAPLAGRPLV